MLVIANGCSHTAGGEIEHSLQSTCYAKAWPKKFADKLGADHYNLAISGASNHRVLRTTIDFISSLKVKRGYDPSNIFCTIMWPGMYRAELYQTEKNEKGFYDNGWRPYVSGNDDRKETSTKAWIYFKAWLLRMNPTQETIDYYLSIITLQNYLAINKIKYLFYNGCKNVPQPARTFEREIFQSRFPHMLSEDKSFTQLMHSEGFVWPDHSVYAHYGEDAHEWFANYLYDYATTNKLF